MAHIIMRYPPSWQLIFMLCRCLAPLHPLHLHAQLHSLGCQDYSYSMILCRVRRWAGLVGLLLTIDTSALIT